MTPKFTQRNSAATAMKIQTSSDLKPKNPRKKTEAISNQSTKLLKNRTTSKYVVDKETGDRGYDRTPYETTTQTGTKTTKKRLIGGRTVEKSNIKEKLEQGIRTNVTRNIDLGNKNPMEREQFDQNTVPDKVYNISSKVVKDKKGNVVRTKTVINNGIKNTLKKRTRG